MVGAQTDKIERLHNVDRDKSYDKEEDRLETVESQ